VAAPEPKRRLPVLQQSSSSPDEGPQPEERPPGQWIVASAVITLVVWLLLAGTVNLVLQRLGAATVAPLLVANLLVLFVSAAIAGMITGRLGIKAERKHAIYGALAAGVVGWLFALPRGGAQLAEFIFILAVMLGINAGGAAVGFRLGRPRR
jgi:hypothetical protein